LAFPANILVNPIAGEKHPANPRKQLRAQNNASAYLIVSHAVATIGAYKPHNIPRGIISACKQWTAANWALGKAGV